MSFDIDSCCPRCEEVLTHPQSGRVTCAECGAKLCVVFSEGDYELRIILPRSTNTTKWPTWAKEKGSEE